MRNPPGLLIMALLAVGVGAGGTVAGFFVPESGASGPYRSAISPALEMDPNIPFRWGPEALSPIELQAMGLERAMFVLALLGLFLLSVGIISATLNAVLAVSTYRRDRAIRGLVGAPPLVLIGGGFLRALVHVAGATIVALAIVIGATRGLLSRWPGEVIHGAPSLALPVLSVVGGASVVLLAASLPLLRVLRTGWLGDALAPNASANPGLDEEKVQAVTVTGQLLVAISLVYGAGLLILTEGISVPARGLAEGAGSLADRVLFDVEADHIPFADRWRHYEAFLREVEGIPGVATAALASRGSLGGRGTLDWVLTPIGGQLLGTHAEHHSVSPEWFSTVGVAVDGHGPRGSGVAVNATMGRFLGWDGPAGTEGAHRPVRLGGSRGEDAELIGLLEVDLPVVAPGWGRLYRVFPFVDVTSRTPPVVYLPFEEFPPERAELLLGMSPKGDMRPTQGSLPMGEPNQGLALEDLEVALGEAANRADLSTSSLDPVSERLAAMAAPVRWLRTVAGSLAGLAVGLSLLGVAGALRGTARRRVAELGMRRAVGGSRARVMAGALSELILPAVVAAWLGLGIAVAAAQSLTAMLARAAVFDLPLYLGSLVLVMLVGVLAAFAPLLQATSLPPAEAVRIGEAVEGGGLA